MFWRPNNLPYFFFIFKQFVMDFTNGDGMGRVCECSGAPVMVNSSFSYLRKGGTIVMVGLPKQPLHVENVLQDVGKC
jgi:D-xylulose reductase